MSDSLRPHELQHARPPCPSPTARVYPNPCPLSRWCHPTISSSVVPFSSRPQSFPASGPFQMSQLFIHIRWQKLWSFNFNISPSNEHPGLISFRMDWLDLLAVQGTLKSLPSIRVCSNESVLLIRWPKYWSFSFGITPSSEYSELISFRMGWLALLSIQGTLKSLL